MIWEPLISLQYLADGLPQRRELTKFPSYDTILLSNEAMDKRWKKTAVKFWAKMTGLFAV